MVLTNKTPTNGFMRTHRKGLAPFPFQFDAFEFITRRLRVHKAAYLAADPGLGKTIVACLLTNARNQSNPLQVVYVCPPSLRPNVEFEFKKWGLPNVRMPRIVGDTELHQLGDDVRADLIFVDEAHRFINDKSRRSKALHALAKRAKHVVFLSGTPMPNNRPIEVWPIVSRYAPDVFGTNFFAFAKKYCAPKKVVIGRKPDGSLDTRWNFNGSSNREEFKARLFKSFMIRQKKSCLDLPEKREGLLAVGENVPDMIGKLEQKILSTYSKKDLSKAGARGSVHFAEYLRLLGQEKLKHLYPFIEHLIYETKENVLFFTRHKQVADDLVSFLVQFKPIVITGETPKKARKPLVDAYQAGETRFGVLNIVAGGIGWNLTRADRVLIIEPSWCDGENEQAGDRAHRIGRTKPVLVQYVVLKDSYDAKRMSIILGKRHGAV